MSKQADTQRIRLKEIRSLYQNREKICVLTSYDAITASLVEDAGVEIILVGDSLGNVVLGYENTIPVTMEDSIRHTQAVMRGTQKSFVVFDLPFGETISIDRALRSSVRAMKESGCHAVKLEGGETVSKIVEALTQNGIPVMGHIGLQPQSIHQLGFYKRQGKSEEDKRRLLQDAKSLEKAGAFAVVLECIEEGLAKEITDSLSIPTIGIGSGVGVCSGEVLVLHDLIGLGLSQPPSFVRQKANVASIVSEAVLSYVRETKNGV